MIEKAAFLTIQTILYKIGNTEVLARASTYQQIYSWQIFCLYIPYIPQLDGIGVMQLGYLYGNIFYFTGIVIINFYASPF